MSLSMIMKKNEIGEKKIVLYGYRQFPCVHKNK